MKRSPSVRIISQPVREENKHFQWTELGQPGRCCQLRRSTGPVTKVLLGFKLFTHQNEHIDLRFINTRIPL